VLEIRDVVEDDFIDLLHLLLKFGSEFNEVYPVASARKVATEIENHFKNGFIKNAYKDKKLVGSIGAMKSSWWFSDEQFVAETWFYVLPEHRDYKTARGLLQELIKYGNNMTIQLPVSSGKDTPSLYERMGFKEMGNIWRYN